MIRKVLGFIFFDVNKFWHVLQKMSSALTLTSIFKMGGIALHCP